MGLSDVFSRIGRPRLLVVGDVMLDEYVWGDVVRVSPEAPVPILRATRREVRLGGAASVAALLRGLEAHVQLAGVIGADSEGRSVQRLLADEGIGAGTLLVADRPTTSKQRLLGMAGGIHPQQMLRVDQETCAPLTSDQEEWLRAATLPLLAKCDGLLVSDYAKGVCTPGLLGILFAAARDRGIPVLVDPARVSQYDSYQGATLVIPNRAEAELVTGHPVRGFDDAVVAGLQVLRACAAEAAVIKLDREGMILVKADERPAAFPTDVHDVHDVTGAGDMVLATLGICCAVGVDLPCAVRLANVAAGLEVQRWGVSPVTRAELVAELRRSERLLPVPGNHRAQIAEPDGKIISSDKAAAIAEQCRRAGRRVVFTNGCFDLLHAGHLRCLKEAAALGDLLIVAVNSDASVRRLKGPERPVIGEEDRLELLAALACVSHVLLFDEDTPRHLLRRIRPDVLVKGGTYRVDEVVGHEIAEAYGGQVRVVGVVEGVSTTGILRAARTEKAAIGNEVARL
jgi:D-beta-D-heptose 7-phosphate kinase/D-beta-D-heptose 1-phosphate adenosyltransferase